MKNNLYASSPESKSNDTLEEKVGVLEQTINNLLDLHMKDICKSFENYFNLKCKVDILFKILGLNEEQKIKENDLDFFIIKILEKQKTDINNRMDVVDRCLSERIDLLEKRINTFFKVL